MKLVEKTFGLGVKGKPAMVVVKSISMLKIGCLDYPQEANEDARSKTRCMAVCFMFYRLD